MRKDTAWWIAGYVVAIVVVLGVTATVTSIYFGTAPTLPFGLDRLVRPVAKLATFDLPTPFPMRDPNLERYGNKPANSVHITANQQGGGSLPVYTVRLILTSPLAFKDNAIRGIGKFINDPAGRPVSFTVVGTAQDVVVGFHKKNLIRSMPIRIQSMTLASASGLLKTGMLIQLRVAPDAVQDMDKLLLVRTLNAIAEQQWQYAESLTIPAYSIETEE